MAVILAKQYGGTPLDYWHADAGERERLLELLAVEGEVAAAFHDLAPGDEVVYVDDD